jgi:signal peptidase I
MNGQLVINGQLVPVQPTPDGVQETLGLPHVLKLTYGGGPDFGPVTLPAGKYLVLGDNRGNSKDGRYFGLVDRCMILGRAVAVYLNSQGLTWRLL